jgi:hypothetical protein
VWVLTAKVTKKINNAKEIVWKSKFRETFICYVITLCLGVFHVLSCRSVISPFQIRCKSVLAPSKEANLKRRHSEGRAKA